MVTDITDRAPPTRVRKAAEFNSRCGWCGEPVLEGDPVVLHEVDGWIHPECA